MSTPCETCTTCTTGTSTTVSAKQSGPWEKASAPRQGSTMSVWFIQAMMPSSWACQPRKRHIARWKNPTIPTLHMPGEEEFGEVGGRRGGGEERGEGSSAPCRPGWRLPKPVEVSRAAVARCCTSTIASARPPRLCTQTAAPPALVRPTPRVTTPDPHHFLLASPASRHRPTIHGQNSAPSPQPRDWRPQASTWHRQRIAGAWATLS